MNALENHSAENLALVAPILDDAIDHLGTEDRAAILLRFFEQKDFRSVGQSLGSSEEAARKRVERALSKLELLLSSLAKLGAKYPPALTALRERRDKASERMLAGTNEAEAAMDFAALNRTLKEDQNTLAVFEQLPPDDPRRPVLASAAYEQLIQAQRYGDALSGKSYAQIASQFELLAADRPLPANVANPDMIRKTQRDHLITSTAKDVEVLAGAGDLEHARMLAARLQAFDPSPDTKALLQQHAARAGQPDLLKDAPNP